jgi:hypothetical protein
VSNVVQFPLSAGAPLNRACFHVGPSLLDDPPAATHAVQFYDDDGFLFDTVGRFLRSGLRAGDAAVIIATPAHADGISSRLEEAMCQEAVRDGRLLVVDAEALLSNFMIGGQPDEALFLGALSRLMTGVSTPAAPARRVRAFGEMVDVLWRRGNSGAALELDALWNRAMSRFDLSLFCAYGMSNFYKQDESGQFKQLCELHTHVIPTEDVAWHTGNAFDCLRRISLLEQRARLLESEVQYRKEVESALEESMLARRRIEAELCASGAREGEQLGAQHIDTTCRELFASILEPLNSVLEVTQRMSLEREPAAHDPSWQQLAASGIRLKSLIEKLLVTAPAEPTPVVSTQG